MCLSDLESYANWSLVLLAGAPMPDRSKVEARETDPLTLQAGGWCRDKKSVL